jgi:hypothetical protein
MRQLRLPVPSAFLGLFAFLAVLSGCSSEPEAAPAERVDSGNASTAPGAPGAPGERPATPPDAGPAKPKSCATFYKFDVICTSLDPSHTEDEWCDDDTSHCVDETNDDPNPSSCSYYTRYRRAVMTGTCKDNGYTGKNGHRPRCPEAAPSKGELDTTEGWKPPPPPSAACSPADVQQFSNNFPGAQTWEDLTKNLPPACGSCLASKKTDAAWKLIVVDPNDASQGTVNWGACYAVKSGSLGCGKAIQYANFCIEDSCANCATTDSGACMQRGDVRQACGAMYNGDIAAACGSNATTVKSNDDACSSAAAAAKTLCGS